MMSVISVIVWIYWPFFITTLAIWIRLSAFSRNPSNSVSRMAFALMAKIFSAITWQRKSASAWTPIPPLRNEGAAWRNLWSSGPQPMAASSVEPGAPPTPLEVFVRDYVETTGGAWDEVEPQVYDVLLPAEAAEQPLDVGGREILRIAFDPEALPEHPGAQLASFGTPLIDRLLADAVQRGRSAQFYLIGLNLAPHDLARR